MVILSAFANDIERYNQVLDDACRARWGVSVILWKTVKYIVELGVVGLSGFAIANGADPVTSLMIAAFVLSGPEALEYFVVRETDGGQSDGTDE